MKKIIVFAIIVILIVGICVGIAYGINAKNKNALTPTFNFMQEGEESKIWVGTFQLAWNSMLNYLGIEKAELEGGNTPLVDELNKKTFTRDELSEEDYYIAVGEPTFQFENKIKEEVKEKFDITETDILDNIMPKSEDEMPMGEQMAMYALLNKEFNFLTEFDRLKDNKFKESEELVKYFGIDMTTDEKVNDNVTVLFYNSEEEFAVKLNTKENEEVYLYRTNEEKTFDSIYKDMLNKCEKYEGNEKFAERDLLEIPYINVDESISYDELLNKDIVNKNGFKISSALQDIEFTLNNKGGRVISEAEITIELSLIEPNEEQPRKFIFNNDFCIFLKEKDKELPYMALKIDNTDFLVNGE